MQKVRINLNPLDIKGKPALFAAFLAFWIPVIVFSKIAGEIIENQPISLDKTILLWIHNHSMVLYDHLFLVITTLANAECMVPIAAVIIGIFWYKNERLKALIVLASVVGASCANVVLKILFHRDRPAFWISPIHEASYSFPSGHAMISSALMASLIFVLWDTRARWWALVGGIIFTILVGYSRLYLGVHYPTDIVAGWCVSILWVTSIYLLAHKLRRRKRAI